MNSRRLFACLLLAGSTMGSTPALAQTVSPAEADALRSEIGLLRARLDALEKRLNGEAPAAASAAAGATAAASASGSPQSPSPALAAAAPPAQPPQVAFGWNGSPQITEGDRAFKVKGRIQADAGYVSKPSGSTDKGLGFSNEVRRIRFGAEGKVNDAIGYKLDLELSDNAVDLVDTYISYSTGRWLLRLGNQNPAWSLDELTGDTTGSVMERAAFTDAFNFERRLGFSAQYKAGALLAQAGVFTDDVASLANASDGPSGGDENNSFSLDGRLVYAPKLAGTQLHLGASAHWRRLGRIADGGVRYRQRPFLHSTNTRLIGTPVLNLDREFGYGGELAAIRGPWWTAGEVYVQRGLRNGLPDLSFWGGYAEVGYFVTRGDTRGYKDGQFVAGRPAHPIDKDGIGSIQLTARYDYLDLNDRTIVGGTQNGYIAAVIWTPVQNLRFNLNYAYLAYHDAVALPSGKTAYDVQVLGTRFEFDF